MSVIGMRRTIMRAENGQIFSQEQEWDGTNWQNLPSSEILQESAVTTGSNNPPLGYIANTEGIEGIGRVNIMANGRAKIHGPTELVDDITFTVGQETVSIKEIMLELKHTRHELAKTKRALAEVAELVPRMIDNRPSADMLREKIGKIVESLKDEDRVPFSADRFSAVIDES